MKVGIVGYARPDMESLLQAYALMKCLKDNKIDCFCTEDLSSMSGDESEIEVNQTGMDRMLHRKYMSISPQKAAGIQQLFIQDVLNATASVPNVDRYVAVNHKVTAETGNDSKTIDFFQQSFEKTEMLLEPLCLLSRSEYEAIAVQPSISGDYIFLDCQKGNRALQRLAKRYAKLKGYSVLSLIGDRMYYDYEQTIEVYDPREYLGIVKEAKAVISDSFLSVFFGILFDKEIAANDTKKLPEKNYRLLSKLHITDHYYRRKHYRISTYEIKNKERVEEILQTMNNKVKDRLLELLGSDKKERRVDCPTNVLLNECCGCYACEAVCPVQAITMKKDGEGFYYPHVNDQCIHCNLCAKVCIKKENHQLVQYEKSYPKVYCVINKREDQRAGSSSGAVFPALAEHVINDLKGVVFGVRFNESLRAETAMAETMDEVKQFYGSKYLKSELKGVYKKVEEQLKADRYVLFTGLPCECAGLKAYLRKEYERLCICEILCHAAPSPDVFKDYTRYLGAKFHSNVKNVIFRGKSKGWLLSKCEMIVEFEDHEPLVVNARRNNYFRGFLKNNISRPGCADCNYSAIDRAGDITIGDFWGIQDIDPEMFDNKGASLLLVNTAKGSVIWSKVQDGFRVKEKTMKEGFKNNHRKPMSLKPERDEFFRRFREEPINMLLYDYNDKKNKNKM